MDDLSGTTISYATEADLLPLAEIVTKAYNKEAFTGFFLEDWPETTTALIFQKARLVVKFASPQTKVIKITDDASGEILGVSAITLKTGENIPERDLERDIKSVPGVDTGTPPGVNWAFAMDVMKGLHKLDEPMKAVKHYGEKSGILHNKDAESFAEIGQFAVSPKYQGKGLGTRLMKFCSVIADEASLPIALCSYPGAHDLYLKLGYIDLGHFDLDLNGYGKKFCGYGIYRLYSMLHEPEVASQRKVEG